MLRSVWTKIAKKRGSNVGHEPMYLFQTFLTSHPRRLLESAQHGFYHAWWRTFWMTKAKIYLCINYLTSPQNSCIKNETRVRETEWIFKIEVHKCTWQRKENCDRKSTGTWVHDLHYSPFFLQFLFIWDKDIFSLSSFKTSSIMRGKIRAAHFPASV
jgi:hypothetical protein